MSKLRSFLAKDHTLFLGANLLFSASTYAVMLIIPYLVTMEVMAYFSAVYNALMILLFVCELGLSVSYLCFYQLYKRITPINTLLQITILGFLTLVVLSGATAPFLAPFALDDCYAFPLIGALIVHLGWGFSKNSLLTRRKFTDIFGYSLLIFLLRIILLGVVFFSQERSLETIIFILFIIPLAPALLPLLSDLRQLKHYHPLDALSHTRLRSIIIRDLYRYMRYSLSSYIIGILYIIAGRYLMIYLTDQHAISLLADLGYAMTFLGIMTIASSSFRTYFVSQYHLGDQEAIAQHIHTFLRKIPFYSLIVFVMSILMSVFVALIKPHYLTFYAPWFVFILVFFYGLIFLLSMVTFLARTMGYNTLEFGINIVRLTVIVLITHTLILTHPLTGFLLIHIALLGAEIVFALIILKKLGLKPAQKHCECLV